MSACAILAHSAHYRQDRQNMANRVTSDSIEDEMVRGRRRCQAASQHSAMSKSIGFSGADCEAPAGAV